MATKITIRTLLEAGCHFGHQTRRWNPKMKPYIFGERNGMYILDLKQTIINADQAYTFLRNTAKSGKILFVGTKKQAQEAVKNAAERCGINQRWLGGMLTNFVTIRSRINRMEELEGMVADGSMALRGKKEQSVLGKELAKLQANLGGARDLKGLPAALFVIDTKREENAITLAATSPSSLCSTPTPTPTRSPSWASASPATMTPFLPSPSCASSWPTPASPAATSPR